MIPHLSSPLPSISLYIPLDFLNLDQKMIQQKPKFLFLSPIFSTQDTFGIEQVFELPIEPSVAVAGDAGKPFVASEEATAAAQEVEKLAESVIQDGKWWKTMENRGKTWEKRGKQGGELMRFKMDFKFFFEFWGMFWWILTGSRS